MNGVKDFIIGYFIGLANLIPGVSGGTFALIFGVYERIIHFLNSVNLNSLQTLFQFTKIWITSGFSSRAANELMTHLRQRDYPFIMMIGTGAVACILSLSAVMKYFLLHHFIYTYAFFFGLIILSVIIPWRMIKTFRPFLLLPLLLGIVLTVGVAAAVNPYHKALGKSELLKDQYAQQEVVAAASAATTSEKFSFVGKYTAGEYLYIFVCGVIAISAMVLPGVSGSLVLILMNQYFSVISAIANIRNFLLDDLIFLGVMVLGILVGLFSFARLIDFAFRRYHDAMVCFLIGLIAGSLYSLWPFKEQEVIADYYVKEGAAIEHITNYTVYSNINVLPPDWQTGLLATVAVFAGMIVMRFFIRQESS